MSGHHRHGYRPTHVQRMRAGRAVKLAARGEVIPVRRASARGEVRP